MKKKKKKSKTEEIIGAHFSSIAGFRQISIKSLPSLSPFFEWEAAESQLRRRIKEKTNDMSNIIPVNTSPYISDRDDDLLPSRTKKRSSDIPHLESSSVGNSDRVSFDNYCGVTSSSGAPPSVPLFSLAKLMFISTHSIVFSPSRALSAKLLLPLPSVSVSFVLPHLCRSASSIQRTVRTLYVCTYIDRIYLQQALCMSYP